MPESLYRKKSGIKIQGETAAAAKPVETKKSSKAAPAEKKSPAKKAAKKK